MLLFYLHSLQTQGHGNHFIRSSMKKLSFVSKKADMVSKREFVF